MSQQLIDNLKEELTKKELVISILKGQNRALKKALKELQNYKLEELSKK